MKIFDETIEVGSFDEAVTNEYEKLKDEDMIFPKHKLDSFLNVSSEPIIAYPYAIYLLKDSEIKNKDVLNIACGTGEESIILAHKGADVFGIDISPISVRIAQKRAVLNNMSKRIHTETMSVYDLKFPDGTFQYVYGNSCLHHFDLEKAMLEIHRVLKPGSIGIFREPFGGSRVLQKIRDFVPIERNIISPYERQLTYDDINIIKKLFKTVTVKEFGLFDRLIRIIKNEKVMINIYKIDNILLKRFDFLKKYSRRIVIKVVK